MEPKKDVKVSEVSVGQRTTIFSRQRKYDIIITRSRVDFCSIRENIRTSLVEPKYPWWDQTSSDIFPISSKNLT